MVSVECEILRVNLYSVIYRPLKSIKLWFRPLSSPSV